MPGGIDIAAILAALAGGSIIFLICVARAVDAATLRERILTEAHGDMPHLPRELLAKRREPTGGRVGQGPPASRRAQGMSLTHSKPVDNL